MQGAETVEITIPARAEFVSVARLTAATVAARQGFTYDEIEDLKIAVGEACTSLILAGTDPGRPLKVRFLLSGDALEVKIATQGPGIALEGPPARARGEPRQDLPSDESKLGILLMQCLVDEVEARHNAASGVAELRLVKRRQGSSDGGSPPHTAPSSIGRRSGRSSNAFTRPGIRLSGTSSSLPTRASRSTWPGSSPTGVSPWRISSRWLRSGCSKP